MLSSESTKRWWGCESWPAQRICPVDKRWKRMFLWIQAGEFFLSMSHRRVAQRENKDTEEDGNSQFPIRSPIPKSSESQARQTARWSIRGKKGESASFSLGKLGLSRRPSTEEHLPKVDLKSEQQDEVDKHQDGQGQEGDRPVLGANDLDSLIYRQEQEQEVRDTGQHKNKKFEARAAQGMEWRRGMEGTIL